jgi:ribonuclease VapC
MDSYAMLAFFRNEDGSDKVEQILNDASDDKHKLFMTCVNAGEVYYMSVRKDGHIKAELAWKALLQFPIQIIDANLEFSLAAAKIKAKHSISYADAFAAALTINKKAILITGDTEFKLLLKEPNFKVKFL